MILKTQILPVYFKVKGLKAGIRFDKMRVTLGIHTDFSLF